MSIEAVKQTIEQITKERDGLLERIKYLDETLKQQRRYLIDEICNEEFNSEELSNKRKKYRLHKKQILRHYNSLPEWYTDKRQVVWIEETQEYLLLCHPNIKIYYNWVMGG